MMTVKQAGPGDPDNTISPSPLSTWTQAGDPLLILIITKSQS